jgi:hypothetical protein
MPKLMADPLPPGCPWSGWTPPNVDWCEEELCSWVVNPADTWSNLAYLGFGAAMALRARGRHSPVLSLFAPASVLVGIFSFVYHASYTWFLQFFDFVGMFVFCFTVITANALRLHWIRPERAIAFLAAGVVLFSALVLVVSETTLPIQGLVALLIAAVVGQEWTVHRRDPTNAPDYRAFRIALGLLAAAALCSLADVTRTFCDPKNHWLQGHAVWHVLSAASLYAMFRFYEGIEGRASTNRDPSPAVPRPTQT